ncbi:MAG: CoA transferase [Chloroflexota bacterium]|nr:MAG: CoA transferase [Chloroflexota bacterium]
MTRQLGECRALDLTDAKGFLCGAILAQLGVDVVKVEKPGGDDARRTGPFVGDLPHPERSLSWIAYNVNKRAVTLNLECSDGKELFRRLAATADFVIESFAPGYLGSLGLDYEWLKAINPVIIVVSITPFGQTGPYADYRGDELTVLAMSGFLLTTGDPDRPPVRIAADQAYLHASAYGAAGALLAHRARHAKGIGQHVDVSAQESLAIALGGVLPMWQLAGANYRRSGPFLPGPNPRRIIFQCRDGYIAYQIQGIPGRWKGLVDWMASEPETRGAADYLRERLQNLDFVKLTLEEQTALEDIFADFFAKKTRGEIWEQARRRRFIAYPVNDVGDSLRDEQLKAREYFASLPCPELGGEIPYPRYLYVGNGGGRGSPRPAARIGEHNHEVFCQELGLTDSELERLVAAGAI